MSSTASQELHRHLAELEQDEVFSHKRLKEMASLVDAISPTPLAVVAIGDAELVQDRWYHVKYKKKSYWLYDVCYSRDHQGFWAPHQSSICLASNISHVIEVQHTTKALNTAVEGLR